MPTYQEIPREEPHPIAGIASAFANRAVERQRDDQDRDSLKDMYSQFKNAEMKIEDMIAEARTRPGLSPTARVTAVGDLVKVHEFNNRLRVEELKNQRKRDKELAKEESEEQYDEAELQFLDEMDQMREQGKTLSSSEIYREGRQRGIPRNRVKDLANLTRMDSRENRLTRKELIDGYKDDIKAINEEAKGISSPAKKKPFNDRITKRQKQLKEDLRRFDKGERNFVPQSQQEEYDQIEKELQESQLDPIIEELTEAFPPDKFKDVSKWDDDGNEYKSDGKTWKLVKNAT